jgi:hypothetical protein
MASESAKRPARKALASIESIARAFEKPAATAPAAYDNASAERSTNTSETGKREKLTCALPYSGEHSERIIDDLEKSLAESFGGFTKTAMLGGWIDSTGTLLRERGAVYSVSYVPGKTNRQSAKTLFIAAGWLMGEQWIHIERSYFEAEHESTEID